MREVMIMKYCLHCGSIYAESYIEYENESCMVCGFQLIEDTMTEEQFLKLSESEKDDYELKVYNICKQSEFFDEREYNRQHNNLANNWYFTFRFDKYEQLTGEKAYTKENKPYHEMEAHKRFQEVMAKHAGTMDNNAKIASNNTKIVNKNIPRCPICQSTKLAKISTGQKLLQAGFGGIWGMDVLSKTYECLNCGSKF